MMNIASAICDQSSRAVPQEWFEPLIEPTERVLQRTEAQLLLNI